MVCSGRRHLLSPPVDLRLGQSSPSVCPGDLSLPVGLTLSLSLRAGPPCMQSRVPPSFAGLGHFSPAVDTVGVYCVCVQGASPAVGHSVCVCVLGKGGPEGSLGKVPPGGTYFIQETLGKPVGNGVTQPHSLLLLRKRQRELRTGSRLELP